jgi:hypothetical protein
MPGFENVKLRVIQHAMPIEMTVRPNVLSPGRRSVSGFQITFIKFMKPRELTAR